jgi:hypothetical protein
MRKSRNPRADDPTMVFRKQAVWLFPGVFLVHSLFVYGAYRPLLRASLIAALASTAVGLATRWVRSVTTVQALAMFLIGFFMLHTMGILVPLSFVAVVDRRELIGWVAGSSSFALLAMLVWRTHASLRREWSVPLEQSPGVVLYTHDHTLVRVAVENQSRFLPVTGIVMLVTLVVLLLVARGTSWYLFVAMVVAPTFVAVVGCDLVARMIAFLWVIRRWEIEHGVKLRVPPLR